jgi:hypothetical protein
MTKMLFVGRQAFYHLSHTPHPQPSKKPSQTFLFSTIPGNFIQYVMYAIPLFMKHFLVLEIEPRACTKPRFLSP